MRLRFCKVRIMDPLKDLFLLDPTVVFLNHGSFGACPRQVFEIYQEWQLRLERQPVSFLGREFPEYDRQARQVLGEYLNAPPDDLAFIPNATYGVNLVARSLNLKPEDEVLTTDHEYGACDNTWDFICSKTGATYVRHAISMPAASHQEVVESIWQGVTENTKAIYMSHITSPTALRLPVEEICQRARNAGMITIIDGAHAPGQIPLDLQAIGADFYIGDGHKWMLCPRGVGFLYTRPERQDLIEPLIVSWGYNAGQAYSSGSRYIDYLQWSGTKDPAAALSVPAAIRFMEEHDWQDVRARRHALACQARWQIENLTGLESMYPDQVGGGDASRWFYQMFSARLPEKTNPDELKSRLYDDFHIEVPVISWNEQKLLRVSIQGYNDQADVGRLLEALEILL